MRAKTASVGALAISFGVFAAWAFSCGREAPPGKGRQATTQQGTVEDPSQPLTVGIGTAALEIPGDSLPAGSQVTLAIGTEPGQFRAVSEHPRGSQVAEAAAKDAAGQPIGQAQKPMTLALDVTGAALALDGDVARTPENLCVLGLAADGTALVWRAARIAQAEGSARRRVPTVWFGRFLAVYCGDAPLAGFKEVNADGTGVEDDGVAGLTPAFGSCDMRASGKRHATCAFYTGTLFKETASVAAYRQVCANGGATFAENTPCPAGAVMGDCVFNGETTFEFAWRYYDGKGTVEAAKAECAQATGTWHAPDAFTFGTNAKPFKGDPAEGVEPVEVAEGDCGDLGPSCMNPEDQVCIVYVGGVYQTPQGVATMKQICANVAGTFSNKAGACPKANQLGCCDAKLTENGRQFSIIYPRGARTTAEQAKQGCIANGGKFKG